MAVSSVSGAKRPKVIEESESSEEEEEEEDEFEAEVEEEDPLALLEENEMDMDVEVKEEVKDYCIDDSSAKGKNFLSYLSTNNGSSGIKEEEENEIYIKEEEELEIKNEPLELEDTISSTENEAVETNRKRRIQKAKKFDDSCMDSDDSEDLNDDFSEQGSTMSDEDNFGNDESNAEGESETAVGSGLANVMAKILGTKKSEDVILSKAKTDREVKKSSTKVTKEDTFEVVDSSGKIRKEPVVKKVKEEEKEEETPDVTLHHREIHRKAWEEKFRKRPNIAEDKEKERRLRVLATQGVVQLFSAIEKHRNMMQVKLSQCRSVMGREKVMEGLGKEAFLDILKQQGKRLKGETEPAMKKIKKEEKGQDVSQVKEESFDLQLPENKKPKWNVLSNNFYKEPTLHGWDQQSDDGED